MAHEFEISLALSARAAAALPHSSILAMLVRGKPRTISIETSYWDNPALDLRRCGFTLRMRRMAAARSQRAWLQSMKAHTGVPFLRHEIERSIDGPRPDLSFARRAATRMGLQWPGALGNLRPIFTTRISRTTWRVLFADGEAELALDRGSLELEQGASSLAVCEVEIELAKGPVARIYELAFRLVHELPGARVLFHSKADRGYALASGDAPPPRRAGTSRAKASSTSSQLVVRAAADCLSQVQANVEGARVARDPQYLHQLRIGVRRTRTLFRVCRAAHVRDVPDPLRREIKWLWNVLGAARDRDVLVDNTWPAVIAAVPRGEHAIEAFAQVIERERKASHAALRRVLEGKRFQKLLLALGWYFANAAADEAHPRKARKLARRILEKQYARVCRDGTRLGEATEAQRHQLRIDAKKLRYLAEFFQSLYSTRASHAFVRKLSRLQDVLGELNDLAAMQSVTPAAVAQLGERDAALISQLLENYAVASRERLLQSLDQTRKSFASAKVFWNRRAH